MGTHETPSPISNPPSAAKHTAIVFSGGLSVAEWEQESGTGFQPVLSAPPTVEYTRGPDMGGGVGGLLYSKRGSSLKYNLSNGRGDIVAQADQYASLTWTASYEAYGKRTKETGTNLDKQRGNSKDEDPTGLLNEGFRYRDLETGVWLSRDPAGFVDGPNLYAYCKQNPWTGWDPHGLADKKRAYQGSQQLRGEQPIRAKGDQSDAIKLFETKTQTIGIRTDLGAVWRDVKKPMTFLGGLTPGIGEAQDTQVIFSEESTAKDRVIAGVSLAANVLTGGLLPNFGKTTKVMTEATEAAVDTTKGTITSSQREIVERAADAAKTGPGQSSRVIESMSDRAANYQSRVTGAPPDVSYVANGVKFDGFDATRGVLLDAKGPGYAAFVKNGQFQPWYKGADGFVSQAQRQVGASGGTPIEWHFAEEAAANATRNLFQSRGIEGISVLHTP